jgi:hypothetical protein
MPSFVPVHADDPLEAAPTPERLFLFDGALLTQEHFRLEQTYHRSRLARILSMLHGYGTVVGLNVAWLPPEGGPDVEIEVAPGIAVDRLGRLIEHGQRSCLRLGVWFDQQVATPEGRARIDAGLRPPAAGLPDHVVIDVYLAFEACGRVPEPAFATANTDTLDGVQPSRLLDAADLTLLVRAEGDDRLPQGVAAQAIPGAPTIAAIRDFKRLQGWTALLADTDPFQLPSGGTVSEHDVTVQDGSEVFLARLTVPVAADADGVPRFDPTVALNAAAFAPAQDARPYAYSAAEIVLLTDQIRS